MQEPFTVVYAYSEPMSTEDFLEWANWVTNTKITKICDIVVAIGIVLILLMELLMLAVFQENILDIPTLLALAFAVALLYIGRSLYPKHLANKRWQAYKKELDGSLRTTTFTDDRLVMEQKGTILLDVPYTQIKKQVLTRNLFILVLKDRRHCFMRQDGFAPGELSAVQERIQRA